jgi:hypothetical protein
MRLILSSYLLSSYLSGGVIGDAEIGVAVDIGVDTGETEDCIIDELDILDIPIIPPIPGTVDDMDTPATFS